MTERERIGANIRRRLGEKGIKHVYVARKCGISSDLFLRILQGKRKIRPDELAVIAEVIGCTPEALIQQS